VPVFHAGQIDALALAGTIAWDHINSARRRRARIEEALMWQQYRKIAVFAAIFTIAVGPATAQPSQTKGDTYTWNGEFVSLDTTTKTMTVKSRVAYQEAVSELTHFKVGDRVWILWSGVHDYSDAVRQIRRPAIGSKIGENLMLPAELGSTDASDQYITFRVKVPESVVSAMKTLKPGEWITVTSPHRPSTDDEAVVAVKPYGSSSGRSSRGD
jgi:hypothetical protein